MGPVRDSDSIRQPGGMVMTRWISFVVLALVALVLVAGSQPVNSQRTQNFNGFELVDKQGNIRKPTEYRDRYELHSAGSEGKRDARNVCHARHSRVLPQNRKVSRWHRAGERNLRHRSRTIDDR